MKAVRIVQPHQVEIAEIPIPTPGEKEILIRVEASGICGTDLHILRGEYMGNYPVIPGHEFSGTVVETGAGVTRFRVGDRVAVEPNLSCDACEECLNNRQNFCRNWQAVGVTLPGGMAEYVVVPEKAAFAVGDLPAEQAAFMEPLSCVLHGMENLSPRMGDRLLIIGAGPIGVQLMRVARLQGAAHITMVERNPARLMFAAEAGADRALSSLDDLSPDSFDAVIDATGVPAVLSRTLDYVRPGGKVLWFGVPRSDAAMTLEPFKIFRKGLTVMGSFTSKRNSYQAVALLQSGALRVDDLISHRLPLADFLRGCELLEQGAEGVKKVMILPQA